MIPRFTRDPRATLFSAYDSQQQRTKSKSASPAQRSSPYATHLTNQPTNSPYATTTYTQQYQPYSTQSSHPTADHRTPSQPLRSNSTSNLNAQPQQQKPYSDAVLSSLESQNDDALEGMSAKVRMLKDITTQIGTEIRSSSKLADQMNEGFESTRNKLRGTWGRMLRMAERTGVGWRVWVLFFAVVCALFWWVWVT